MLVFALKCVLLYVSSPPPPPAGKHVVYALPWKCLVLSYITKPSALSLWHAFMYTDVCGLRYSIPCYRGGSWLVAVSL